LVGIGLKKAKQIKVDGNFPWGGFKANREKFEA
jgi:hypothetical protein